MIIKMNPQNESSSCVSKYILLKVSTIWDEILENKSLWNWTRMLFIYVFLLILSLILKIFQDFDYDVSSSLAIIDFGLSLLNCKSFQCW
jgi:hypothetical protein